MLEVGVACRSTLIISPPLPNSANAPATEGRWEVIEMRFCEGARRRPGMILLPLNHRGNCCETFWFTCVFWEIQSCRFHTALSVTESCLWRATSQTTPVSFLRHPTPRHKCSVSSPHKFDTISFGCPWPQARRKPPDGQTGIFWHLSVQKEEGLIRPRQVELTKASPGTCFAESFPVRCLHVNRLCYMLPELVLVGYYF